MRASPRLSMTSPEHHKGHTTKCRLTRHFMTWVCCCLDQFHTQAPIKSTLQRVIFGTRVLWVLEAKQIGFRANLW